MYFLVLAALLQLDEYAPKAIAPPTDMDTCLVAAQKGNEEDPRIGTDEGKALGLRYVCLKLITEV